MTTPRIEINRDAIAEFCRRHRIRQLALFGSVLRDDFRPDSDIDILATFAPESRLSLLELASIDDELREMFGRDVDLVDREALRRGENYLRRRQILDSAEVVYAEG